jgi:hypothetical protein
VITRLSAFSKAGIDLGKAAPGGRGQNLDGVLPDKAQWPSHNYNHLMEQPTLFYATVAIIAISGTGVGLNVQLAWAYVVLRILHSLWQSTVNKIPVRFTLFLLSTLCLIALALRALLAVI